MKRELNLVQDSAPGVLVDPEQHCKFAPRNAPARSKHEPNGSEPNLKRKMSSVEESPRCRTKRCVASVAVVST